MPAEPLFAGLVFDEDDQLVETKFIGSEPCYVVDDDGFAGVARFGISDLQPVHGPVAQPRSD